jgi:hypothetical protein
MIASVSMPLPPRGTADMDGRAAAR